MFRFIAVVMPLALMVIIDLGMRLVGLVPPDDPRTFYFRTHEREFSPFVQGADGHLTIRPDWINTDNPPRVLRGARPGRRYLAPGFRPCRIRMEKPSGTVRIVTLGGSTTFGMFVEDEATFSAALKQQLEKVVGSQKVEMLNLGCPGWASDRVASLLNTVIELAPDLIIVYVGHNEMLEGHRESPHFGSGNRFRALLLTSSTIIGWVNHAVISLRPTDEYQFAREEASAINDGFALIYNPIAVLDSKRRLPSQTYVNEAVSKFRANIQTMIARARQAEVPLLFCMPVTNLLSPPGMSAHPEGFVADTEFEELLGRIVQAIQHGRFDQAMADLECAAEMSLRYALVHYWRGLILMDRGDWDAALIEFQHACDFDARPWRMTSPLESALVDAVEASGGRLVDPRPTFYEEIRSPGDQAAFVDHCHPSPFGHQLIAGALLPEVLDLLGFHGEDAANANDAN